MTEKKDPKAIEVTCEKKDEEKAIAQTYLHPVVMASATIKSMYKSDERLNVNALITELNTQVSKIKEGNLERVEALLIAQAHTLDTLFTALVSRSYMNMGEYLDAADKYMRMALKAQGQCRTTLETLSLIKNPRPIQNIRQQNLAGQQIVNNGVMEQGEKNKIITNELLEGKSHERMDGGPAKTASRADKKLAAVGTQHGAENS